MGAQRIVAADVASFAKKTHILPGARSRFCHRRPGWPTASAIVGQAPQAPSAKVSPFRVRGPGEGRRLGADAQGRRWSAARCEKTSCTRCWPRCGQRTATLVPKTSPYQCPVSPRNHRPADRRLHRPAIRYLRDSRNAMCNERPVVPPQVVIGYRVCPLEISRHRQRRSVPTTLSARSLLRGSLDTVMSPIVCHPGRR